MMADDEIELFSTPSCPYCRSAKDYLSRRGLSFRAYDVSHDQQALQRMLSLSGRAIVPTIRVGEEVLVGFDATKLDQMIGRLGRGSNE